MDELVPAWFGTHSNRSSRAFAVFSVFVFPVTALTLAWLQSEEDINFAQLVTGEGLLITALCCALSLKQLRLIRKELAIAFEEVRLSNRAERRDAIWKKLAERRERREAKKEDDDPC
jgi:hypothetical protein